MIEGLFGLSSPFTCANVPIGSFIVLHYLFGQISVCSSANYTWLTPIMTAQDIFARVLCGSGLNDCLYTLAPRLMVVSFGVGGGDGATNVGSRRRNGADGGVNEVDDQAEVWGRSWPEEVSSLLVQELAIASFCISFGDGSRAWKDCG